MLDDRVDVEALIAPLRQVLALQAVRVCRLPLPLLAKPCLPNIGLDAGRRSRLLFVSVYVYVFDYAYVYVYDPRARTAGRTREARICLTCAGRLTVICLTFVRREPVV